MQIAILTLALFGWNLGVVEYHDANNAPAYLLCVDNGTEGVCYNAAGALESAYYCEGGCVGF